MDDRKKRCWSDELSDLMRVYHDCEWGVPLHDDRLLFEAVILDGVQAGLSWEIVLKKRENYRRAFHNFDAEEIARYGKRDIERLMNDVGIIRNRRKIEAAVANARCYLRVLEDFPSFDEYMWQFVGGEPIVHRLRSLKQMPTESKQSRAMSKDLKQRGFKFVGPTICYALMQATGMVNDHLVTCFRWTDVQEVDVQP